MIRGSILLRTCFWLRTGSSACRLKALIEDNYKVGGKGSHHAPISPQSSNPPRSISRIETFDQITLNKSEVLVCLSSPRVHRPTPAGKPCRKFWRSRSHALRRLISVSPLNSKFARRFFTIQPFAHPRRCGRQTPKEGKVKIDRHGSSECEDKSVSACKSLSGELLTVR